MKTLIAYYSFTQNNEKLAQHLQKQLNCDMARIETVRRRTSFSILLDLMFRRVPEIKPMPYYLNDYDQAIFIAPIWAGKIAMPMRSFMAKEKSKIKHYSFVTLCGGSPGQKEKIKDELVTIVGKEPDKLVELWVNDLLPAEQKNTVKYTSGFRIGKNGFDKFESQLKDFTAEKDVVYV